MFSEEPYWQYKTSFTKQYECNYSRQGKALHKIFKISYEVPCSVRQDTFQNVRVVYADPIDSSDQARILELLTKEHESDLRLFMASNLVDGEGQRKALHRLVKRTNVEAVRRILKASIKEEVRSDVLYLAAKDKNVEAIRFLLASPEMDIFVQKTTLFALIDNEDREAVHLFLSCGINKAVIKATLCLYAANENRDGLCKLFGSPQVDDTIQVKIFFHLIKQGDSKSIKALVDAGADKMALTVALETAVNQGIENGIKMFADRDVFGAVLAWGKSSLPP